MARLRSRPCPPRPAAAPRLFERLRAPRVPGPRRRAATAPALADIAPEFTPLPARPFAVTVSADAEHAFVTMPRAGGRGVVALARASPWRLVRTLWVDESISPRGVLAEPSGRYLLIANGAGGLVVVDVQRLVDGAADPVAAVVTAPGSGSMQVALEPGQRFAFVTDEDTATVSVFDFGSSLGSASPAAALIGQVPLPAHPVGIACSADGGHLFVTSQAGKTGALSVLRVAEVAHDPERARVFSVPAGASPVRVTLAGEVAWVTARASNAVLAFDIPALLRSDGRALRAVVPVGADPVGLATVEHGSVVVVANSNRYGAGSEDPQTLAVLDAHAALAGGRALRGTIRTGAFPREVTVLPDDETVLVTNVVSQTLETIPLGGRLGSRARERYA